MQSQKMISIGEAAKYLNISRDTLRRWEKKGKIKPFRSPTNRRYYTKEQLDEIMKKPVVEKPKQTAVKTPKRTKKSKKSKKQKTKKKSTWLRITGFGLVGFGLAAIFSYFLSLFL